MSNSCIWPYQMLPLQVRIDLGAMVMKGYFPQSFSITGASPSDCLVSYPGHSLRESYPSAEMQSVYSTAQANWAYIREWNTLYVLYKPFRFCTVMVMQFLIHVRCLESPQNTSHFLTMWQFYCSTFGTSRCLKLSLSLSALIQPGTWTKPYVPEDIQVIFSVTLKTYMFDPGRLDTTMFYLSS